MKLVFSDNAWDDYLFCQSSRDGGKSVDRVHELIKAAKREPIKDIGKPESLRGEMSGWWSKRITDEHRMVYRVAGVGSEQRLEIAQLRHHY